jgi:hypothetical protein
VLELLVTSFLFFVNFFVIVNEQILVMKGKGSRSSIVDIWSSWALKGWHYYTCRTLAKKTLGPKQNAKLCFRYAFQMCFEFIS